MKTAVVEKADTVGGRCLNEACIPAKAVLRVADAMKEVQEAKSFGITTGDVAFDFGGATKHRDKVIKTLTGGVAMLFKKNGIDVIEGHGAVTDDGNVKVGGSFDGSEIEAGKVILATGSIARPVGGLEFGGRIVDTAKMWLTAEQPKRLAVIGAGASGTEVASAFGRLGTDVILLEALDQILPLEEKEIAKATAKEIGKQNVKIVTGANVENVDDSGDAVKIDVGGETHEVDLVCIAAGRGADVEGLGLDDAGIETDDRGLVKVDGALRTSKEGVYAIGDLVPGPALAHKASDEGVIAVEDAAGMDTHPIDYAYVPRVTFCSPQVASFGLTEAAGQGAGLRRGRRQGADGRRRRAHRLRRPRRHGQDDRRQEVRRDPGRAHRVGQGRRADPGAGGGPRPRGRLPRDRPLDPPPPGVRRGDPGGGARHRWLAHPRLSRPLVDRAGERVDQRGQHLRAAMTADHGREAGSAERPGLPRASARGSWRTRLSRARPCASS